MHCHLGESPITPTAVCAQKGIHSPFFFTLRVITSFIIHYRNARIVPRLFASALGGRLSA
jgi:hypothetical protein